MRVTYSVRFSEFTQRCNILKQRCRPKHLCPCALRRPSLRYTDVRVNRSNPVHDVSTNTQHQKQNVDSPFLTGLAALTHRSYIAYL